MRHRDCAGAADRSYAEQQIEDDLHRLGGRSQYALMWQWSGGVGDFDQIDRSRTP